MNFEDLFNSAQKKSSRTIADPYEEYSGMDVQAAIRKATSPSRSRGNQMRERELLTEVKVMLNMLCQWRRFTRTSPLATALRQITEKINRYLEETQ